MQNLRAIRILTYRIMLSAATLIFVVSAPSGIAQDILRPVCNLVIHDEQSKLEDARITVELAKSRHSAYLRIFEMIEGLWAARTISRMDYIRAKYDRDASRLELEKADLLLEKQTSLVDQYRLICDRTEPQHGKGERDEVIRKEYLHYRRADCDSLAKAIEVAETKLEYNRAYLQSILELRRGNVATQTQVILAELEVELEEKSLADARRRTEACRAQTAVLERDGNDSPAKGTGSK